MDDGENEIAKERFDSLIAGAPTLDLADPKHRRMVAEGVLENILGSMLGSMEAHLKKPEKRKRPKPEAYAKIMLDDLKARGWMLVEADAIPSKAAQRQPQQ